MRQTVKTRTYEVGQRITIKDPDCFMKKIQVEILHIERNRKPTPEQKKELRKLVLDEGSHSEVAFSNGKVCAMEAVALITGQKRTDEPVCVANSIVYEMQAANDAWTEKERQQLKALIPDVMGTAPIAIVRHNPSGQVFDIVLENDASYVKAELARNKRKDEMLGEFYSELVEKFSSYRSFAAKIRELAAIEG